MEWLNYHHLHYFWRIAREGSLSRAAEQLRVTHSTLSAQLRSLEGFLGGDLFERYGFLDMKWTDGQSRERRHDSAAAQHFGQIAAKRADVGAAATLDAQLELWISIAKEVDSIDLHAAGGEVHRRAAPREQVRPLAADLKR